MTPFDATPYLDGLPRKKVRRPVLLDLSENTYPPGSGPDRSWMPTTLRAFSQVARLMAVRDLLVVGSGHGLDALGASEIFELDSLTATDLLETNLQVARTNVLTHLAGDTPATHFYSGDLFACIPADARYDLVYENLPNIPAGAGVDLSHGINSSSFFLASHTVPERFESQRLALHYRCLREAVAHLRPGGGVLTSIGGRIPLEVVFDLHRDCGYEPALIVLDAKLQTEPEDVLPGYCAAERDTGHPFVYYAPEIIPLLAARRAADGDADGAGLAAAVLPALQRYAMTSQEALGRHRRGEGIAHLVYVVLGKRGGHS